MEQFELHATVRKTAGNSPARALRRIDQVPAVLYGPQAETVMLSVNKRDLEQILKKSNVGQVILNLVIQNGQKISKMAMIKELQTHPVSGSFLHVDFYEIDMNRKIKVMIPVVAAGKAVGVEEGGILQIVRRELEVLCLPGNIPEVIEIDITALDIGDAVHVEEIPMADGVEVIADSNFTVLTIVSPKVEEIVEEAEEELEEAEAAEGEEASEDAEPAAEE